MKFSVDKRTPAEKKMQKKRVIESSDDDTDSFVDSDYQTYESSDDEEDDYEDDESSNVDSLENEENDNDEEEISKKKGTKTSYKDKKKKYYTRANKKRKPQQFSTEEEKAIKEEIQKAFVTLLENSLDNKKKLKNKDKKETNKGKVKHSSHKHKASFKKHSAKGRKKNHDDNSSESNQSENYSSDNEDSSGEDSDEDYDEYQDDEEDNEEEDAIFLLDEAMGDEGGGNHLGSGGIILLDGGMIQQSDEHDYQQMVKEDKHEKCNSDDEQMFMKENYKPHVVIEDKGEVSSSTPNSTEKSKQKLKQKQGKCKNKTKKNEKKGKHKQQQDEKKGTSKDEDDDDKGNTVVEKYNELVKLRDELFEQLKKSPKNKILQNAVDECKKSIAELVKKERNKNTDKYFKLVHQDPKKSKNTNEMSYFKKKLSHQEQLKVMKDLKEINALTNTDKPYRLSLLESNIPPRFKAIALQKLNVLKSMDPSDSEYYKMKNWVDGFMRVPYGIYKNLTVQLTDGVEKCHAFMDEAKETLDSCTYGLNDAKMQILQMVGQWITNPNAMGTAIAIKGPPGTGKTTLVKEGISKILGREFAFIALGGTSDASFLEGHSYTYEGSAWGKIVSILMDSKCMNPVIYFDELDKISDTPKGEEIASILTHLTDTSQNNQFHDKYFSEVDFDLSKCLFIFSYNDESKVNPILKDRMYRIQTKGYDAKEKIIIARKHLLPKIREQVSFQENEIIISDTTLDYIINHPDFCKSEQGVRNLKRCLEIIHTKLNLFRLVKPEQNMFSKEIAIDVKFPFEVQKNHVDILIKKEDPRSQSLLAMYI